MSNDHKSEKHFPSSSRGEGRHHERHGGRHDRARHGGGKHARRGGNGGPPRGRNTAGLHKPDADTLQLVVLLLLSEAPATGYELIHRLQEKTGGLRYCGPGMVYPTLTYLEETGQVAITPDGNRKVHALTDAGRIHLETSRAQAEEIMTRAGGKTGRHAAAENDPQPDGDLRLARHGVRHALKTRQDRSAEENRRIVGILNRARAEILSTTA